MNNISTNHKPRRLYAAGLTSLVLVVLLSLAGGVAAKPLALTVPGLGTAASFAVLAGTAVTCTDSTVFGDVGVYPGTAVTQTNCTITGKVHAGDGVAKQAQKDFLAAYDKFAAIPCDTILTGTLDGVILTPGVYCFDAAATLTGTLTLSGPSNGIWIFKIGTSGTGALTGTNFNVVMAGDAQLCNVYWWVAQAATMTSSNFIGTILAGAAITVTGGTFNGDALAKAAVTLTGANLVGCEGGGHGNLRSRCNQGVGNGPEGCDPGNSNNHNPSNDETGGTPGDPGRQGPK
jgi:hypothetical protein